MHESRRHKILARIEKRKWPEGDTAYIHPFYFPGVKSKTITTWDEFCVAMGIESKLREPEIEYPDRNKSVPMGARPYHRRKAGR